MVFGVQGHASRLGEKLQSEIAKIVAEPDVKERFAKLGFEAIGSSPDYFAKYIKDEMAKYSKIITEANIKAE